MKAVKPIKTTARILRWYCLPLFLLLEFSQAAEEIVATKTETKPAETQPTKTEQLENNTVTLPRDQQEFIDKLSSEYKLDAEKLTQWLAMAEKKQSIIDAMNRPAEGVMSWKQYRKIFITEKRLSDGLVFWKKYEKDIQRAEKTFGVPAEMIVAIIGVETFYGRIKGNYRILDALYTLGFHYPKRGKFFKSELGHFFRLAEQQQWQIETRKGSYAGAMGYGQFMPSSYISYAVDFDGDGFKDLIDNPVDAIGSVANYFKRHGWKSGGKVVKRVRLTNWKAVKLSGRSPKTQYSFAQLSEKGVVSSEPIAAEARVSLMTFDDEDRKQYWVGFNNFYVISRYNHSHMYSLAAYQLAQQLKKQFKATIVEPDTKAARVVDETKP